MKRTLFGKLSDIVASRDVEGPPVRDPEPSKEVKDRDYAIFESRMNKYADSVRQANSVEDIERILTEFPYGHFTKRIERNLQEELRRYHRDLLSGEMSFNSYGDSVYDCIRDGLEETPARDIEIVMYGNMTNPEAIVSSSGEESDDTDYLPGEEDYQKMEEYQKKGSDPDRLVGSIKDKGKLVRRWLVSLQMEWAEASSAFSDAIRDRGVLSDEEMEDLAEQYA